MWKLRLAPVWPRITLEHAGNMLYKSLNVKLKENNTKRWKIERPPDMYWPNPSVCMLNFIFSVLIIFGVSGHLKNGFWSVLTPPWLPGVILGWPWPLSGKLIFHFLGVKILPRVTFSGSLGYAFTNLECTDLRFDMFVPRSKQMERGEKL